MWKHANTVPVRAVEKWDIQTSSSPKTHHVFLDRQRARRCLSALLPLNKCRQKGAAHCGGFPPGRTRWLVKTKSTDSNWSHYAWWAYWARSCWTAVLWCALFIFTVTDFRCVGLTSESLWGLRVKAVTPREGLKILSQTSSLSAPW